MAETIQPSVLQYARFHGVANGHQTVGLASLIPPSGVDLEQSLQDLGESTLLDVEDVRSSISRKLGEKLDIGKGSAVFLSSTMRSRPPFKDGCGDHWDSLLPNYHRIRGIKQDSPLLRTDHEHDMNVFRSKLSLDSVIFDLPLETPDDENDEGLAFPSYMRDHPGQIRKEVENEKVFCTKGALVVLRDMKTVSFEGSKATRDEIEKYKIGHFTTRHRESSTSPLVPREPTPAPFIPSSTRQEKATHTYPVTAAVYEYEQIQHDLTTGSDMLRTERQDNQNVPPRFVGTESITHTSKTLEANLSAPSKRLLTVGIEVDRPLTPPISTKKRRVYEEGKSPEELLAPGAAPGSLHPDHAGDDPTLEYLLETAGSTAKEIELKSGLEQIHEIDSSIRVSVPHLKFSRSPPPWEITCGTRGVHAVNDPLESIRTVLATSATKQSQYPGALSPSPEENLGLCWDPFHNDIFTLDINEELTGESAHFNFLVEPSPLEGYNGLQLSGSFSHRKILSEESYNELEQRIAIAEGSLSTDVGCHSNVAWEMNEGGLKPTNGEGFVLPKDRTSQIPQKEMGGCTQISLLPSNFSAAGKLSNFMSLRGKGLPRPSINIGPHFRQSIPPNIPKMTRVSEQPRVCRQNKPSGETELLLSTPDTPIPCSPITLIISNTLLQSHRALIRGLEALSVSKTLVFRDYKTFEVQSPGKTDPVILAVKYQPPNGQNNGEDADLVISPMVGILFTTAQETTQLYLPGHSPFRSDLGFNVTSPLRERIFRLCVRYEQMYVLIGHPLAASGDRGIVTQINQRTLDSINSLLSFCSSLGRYCRVTAISVPTSGELLAKWVVSLGHKHCFSCSRYSKKRNYGRDALSNGTANNIYTFPPNVILTEDPSTWELFLWNAGLNSFAAQMVLTSPISAQVTDQLRVRPANEDVLDREGDNVEHQQAFSRFAGMNPNERIRVFGGILGDRVVSRISQHLDTSIKR